MREFIIKTVFVSLSFIILGLLSCTPESCFEETEAFLKASLYDNNTSKLHAPDSISAYGIGKESTKLYNKSRNIQPALLPLNASVDSCGFVVRINGITDTIKLWYSSFPHLISKECGYSFYHILDSLSVTRNTIDTFIIRNRNITTVNEENIRLFY